MAKKLKRPRDPVQLAKLIRDIATGQVEDAMPDDGKNAAAVALGRRGGINGGAARRPFPLMNAAGLQRRPPRLDGK